MAPGSGSGKSASSLSAMSASSGANTVLKKLLRYHFAALFIWLLGTFCLVFVFWFGLCSISSQVIVFPSPAQIWKRLSLTNIFGFLLCALLASWLQFLLTYMRHRTIVSIRRKVFSFSVQVVYSLVLRFPQHIVHALVAVATINYFLMTLYSLNIYGTDLDAMKEQKLLDRVLMSAQAPRELYILSLTTAFVAGFDFSLLFSLTHMGEIQFPAIQMRRLSRFHMSLPSIVVCAFFRALRTVAVITSLYVSGLNRLLLDLSGAEDSAENNDRLWPSKEYIYHCLLLAWLVHLNMSIAAQLYAIIITESKRFGLATPYPVDDDKELDLMLSAIRICDSGSLEEAMLSFPLPDMMDPGISINDKPRSSLLEFAKGSVDSKDELKKWWALTIKSVLADAITSPPVQLCELRKRRMDATIQAIYTADAKDPGRAFWGRVPMDVNLEISRARSFLDFASMGKFTDNRRRLLFCHTSEPTSRRAWIDLVEACTVIIDSLTVNLMVAVKNCALEPTVPLNNKGIPNTEAFVLGPAPREENTVTEIDRRALAWRAEEAARRRRFRPWVSQAWWHKLVFSEFREHDPVYHQRLLFEEKNKEMIDNHQRHAWERQWQQQQKLSSWRWYRNIRDWMKRTPQQCTAALLADCQVVTLCMKILADMVNASTKEDEFGVVQHTIPLVVNCLLDCIIAMEAYASFIGSADAQVLSIQAQADQSMYKLTYGLGKQLQYFPFSETHANILASFVDLKR